MKNYFLIILLMLMLSAVSETYAGPILDSYQRVISPDPEDYGNFGNWVDIEGTRAVIGERDDNTGDNPGYGAVKYYEKINGTWTYQHEIVAESRVAERFGWRCSINPANTDEMVISAPNYSGDEGRVYIFTYVDGTWTQFKILQGSDTSNDDEFGFSVDIYGDYIVATAPFDAGDDQGGGTISNAGTLYIFYRDEGGDDNWGEIAKFETNPRVENGYFGRSVAVYDYPETTTNRDKDKIAVGYDTYNSEQGAVVIYQGTNGDATAWTQQYVLVASDPSNGDDLGYMSVELDGYSTVFAGAADWDRDGQGSADNSGAFYAFDLSDGTQSARYAAGYGISNDDLNADDDLGYAVGMWVGGAWGRGGDDGRAYIFEPDGDEYIFVGEGMDLNDVENFAAYLSVYNYPTGDVCFGAPLENGGGDTDAGAAYFFDLFTYDYDLSAEQYNLIGIPFVPEDGDPIALFGDDFAGAWGTQQRVSRWDEAQGKYIRYNETENEGAELGDPPDFDPGLGFWVVSSVPVTIMGDLTEYVAEGEVDQENRLEQDLDDDESWNMMANPYYYAYTWSNTSFRNATTAETKNISDAVAANWIYGQAYTYNPATESYTTLPYDGADEIATWGGFFFKTKSADDIKMRFMPDGYGGGLAPPAPGADDGNESWFLPLSVQQIDGRYADTSNRLAIHTDANDEFDGRDAFELTPPVNRYVQLYFPHDWDEGSRYTFDYRSTDFNGPKVWDFTVKAVNLPNSQFALTWDGIDDISEAYSFAIESLDQNQDAGNMRTTQNLNFDCENDGVQEFHFRVTVTYDPTSAPVESKPMPEGFGLINAFPNPFNSTITVEYNLPANQIAEVNVFDLTGKLVDQLGSVSGSGNFTWEADGVQSGTYFMQLEAEGQFSLKKVVFMR